MDAYEQKRRDFLKKLGLIGGAAALTGVGGVSALLIDKKDEIVLTAEQKQFMDKYENWLEDFRDMAKYQKIDPEHLENNKKLMALSEEASKWQQELVQYMKDENFARYYMIVSERVTNVI
ncbi:MAG: twin-arginine translocation signal domain-containing protein [Paludibacter sp.]